MDQSSYGICRFSMMPVRAEASHKSEMVNQLLFGESYTVIETSETDSEWLKIRTPFDAYTGWISAKLHTEVTDSYFQAYISTTHAVCTDDVAYVEGNDLAGLITLGSTLPFLQNRTLLLGNQSATYQGDTIELTSINADTIQFVATRFMNAPYLWGGRSIFGIDCSGLVQVVFKILGYQLCRDAYQQARQGVSVEMDQMKVGDLAFFKNTSGEITHVGIFLGQNQIIHAHGHVRIDILDEKGIFNLTLKKYSHIFSHCRRIIT